MFGEYEYINNNKDNNNVHNNHLSDNTNKNTSNINHPTSNYRDVAFLYHLVKKINA